MKNSNRAYLRGAAVLLVFVMAFTCLPAGALADEDELKKEIEELEDKIEKLDEEKDGYNDQLDALSDDMSAVLERKQILDAQIAATQEQVLAIEEMGELLF